MHSGSPKKTASPAAQPKLAGARVFDVAADLFYRLGIRAVGVETIVKQAGVAKISLYRSFESKDDLIVAYLEQRDAAYWHTVEQIVAGHEGNPRAQLNALVTYVANRATTPGYRGCPFINYAAEFPEATHPGHRTAKANKRKMRKLLSDLATAMNAAEPAQLADALMLLIEGAYASSQTLGGRRGPAGTLPWAANALVAAHLAE